MLLHMKQIPNIFTSVVGGVAPTLRALPVHICKREIPEREETRSQTRTGKAIFMCKKSNTKPYLRISYKNKSNTTGLVYLKFKHQSCAGLKTLTSYAHISSGLGGSFAEE